MPKDIVYIFGPGSRWQNNELRYSLRSVDKNLSHGQVFIVGDKVPWLKNIVHIPARNIYGSDKPRNAIYKIHQAVLDSRLAEEFILMNDDFFIIRPWEPVAYWGGLLYEKPAKDVYRKADTLTAKLLESLNIKPRNFSVHTPMPMEKTKVIELLERYPYTDKSKPCHSYKSLYGNTFNVKSEPGSNVKAGNLKALEMCKKGSLLSISDSVLKLKEFRDWIAELFPEPSKYES